MNTLKFKLISNNKEEINEVTNYYIKDNKMIFKIKEDLFEYDINNEYLIKKNKETSIKINLKDKLLEITLLSHNYTVDMEIIDLIIEKEENKVKIEYTFDDGEKNTNCIFITY